MTDPHAQSETTFYRVSYKTKWFIFCQLGTTWKDRNIFSMCIHTYQNSWQLLCLAYAVSSLAPRHVIATHSFLHGIASVTSRSITIAVCMKEWWHLPGKKKSTLTDNNSKRRVIWSQIPITYWSDFKNTFSAIECAWGYWRQTDRQLSH